MGEFISSFFAGLVRGLLIFLVFTPFELLALLLTTWLVVMAFNFSGVAALAGVSYWGVYWVSWGVMQVIEAGVVWGIATMQVNEELS